MKIMMRNLSRNTTEAELLILFQEYGDVQYCKLVMDKATGKSKGFGFVEMPRAGEAKAAIKELNYRDVGGNKIRVKKAEKFEENVNRNDSGTPVSLLNIVSNTQPKNPLHGVKLEMILTDLVERYGWEELGQTINIKCFIHEPSIKSSLKFLRKTPWAREKVEGLYLRSLGSKD